MTSKQQTSRSETKNWAKRAKTAASKEKNNDLESEILPHSKSEICGADVTWIENGPSPIGVHEWRKVQERRSSGKQGVENPRSLLSKKRSFSIFMIQSIKSRSHPQMENEYFTFESIEMDKEVMQQPVKTRIHRHSPPLRTLLPYPHLKRRRFSRADERRKWSKPDYINEKTRQ